jgi:sulfur-oxidizing protein SoxY
VKRRQLLNLLGRFLPVIWTLNFPVRADANSAEIFSSILGKILGKAKTVRSPFFTLDIPDVAENGALVPVTLSSQVPAKGFYLLAEGNPGPLLAEFHFHGNAVSKASFRVKLNQSGPVRALAETPEGWMQAERNVRVTVGGCG